MLLISGIQQFSARKQIRSDLERTAEMELVIKSIAVKHSLEEVEFALRNRNWEGNIKADVRPSEKYNLYAGYDYLSGDMFFAVPPHGGMGLVYHDKLRGFNAIFGSHHEFYGAMDFFYMSTYYGGFTPGLQNLYVGGNVKPGNNLNINAAYHYYAIATNLSYLNTKTLGHSFEIAGAYAFNKFVSVSAGYTFMQGSKTMEQLNRASEKRQLQWAWLILSVKPTLFNTIWQDKK